MILLVPRWRFVIPARINYKPAGTSPRRCVGGSLFGAPMNVVKRKGVSPLGASRIRRLCNPGSRFCPIVVVGIAKTGAKVDVIRRKLDVVRWFFAVLDLRDVQFASSLRPKVDVPFPCLHQGVLPPECSARPGLPSF